MKKFLVLLMPHPSALGRQARWPHAQKKYTIGMSQCNLGEPWRVQMNADIKAAAEKHPELKVIYKDAQNDSLKQRAQVEEFVSAGVDLIICRPRRPRRSRRRSPRRSRRASRSSCSIARVVGDDYTTFIGADNKKIGRAAGKWIAKQAGRQGQRRRAQGTDDVDAGPGPQRGLPRGRSRTRDLKVVFEADMKWLEPNARKEMESALAANPQIDLVYAHNDPGAHGAYLAAKAAGREKEMMFIGIDALPQEGQAYVKQGILARQLRVSDGRRARRSTWRSRSSPGKKVEKEVTLGSRVFTKENVDKRRRLS